jgi:hypothetical protein
MKKCFALLITLGLVSIAALGCSPVALDTADATFPLQAPKPVAAIVTAQSPNFLLLISDEPNDIGDFSELWVTISGVGFVLGDDEGIVEQTFEPTDVPLTELVGDAAIALWSGEVPAGDYTKIFIYVDEVWGILVDPEGEVIEIKLPSNKLQMSLPVSIDGEETTEFVFDISVIKAGNSGQYILKPQLTESGQGAAYQIQEQAQQRTRTGKPDWAGKPHESGKPASAGKPEVAGVGNIMEPPDDAENPDDAGKPSDGGKREEKGRPDWAGTQGGKNEDSSSEDDSD